MQAKAALYDALAESAKALANGRRAELVDVLAQGERSVEELAEEIDQTVANTSQHLQRLLRSGLVESRREGTRIYYSLSSPVVGDLWRTMREPRRSTSRGSKSWRPTTSGTAADSAPSPATTSGRGCATATWSCSTSAPRPSTPPATSAARSPSRSPT